MVGFSLDYVIFLTRRYSSSNKKVHTHTHTHTHIHIHTHFTCCLLAVAVLFFKTYFHFGGFAMEIHTTLNKIIKSYVRNLCQK